MECEQWILCPICKNKTRLKVREHTDKVFYLGILAGLIGVED